MLAHLPILAHGAAAKVLVIGGGDGGMLEEVLKHRMVERAVLVEIDVAVIDFSKQHLRSICGDAFDDPRTEVVVDDGVNFVAATDERFDVIISRSDERRGGKEGGSTWRSRGA